jgi:hypothetical protein
VEAEPRLRSVGHKFPIVLSPPSSSRSGDRPDKSRAVAETEDRVDVEAVAREVDDHLVSEMVLSALERSQLAAVPARPPRRAGLYAAWPRTEAILKALGRGLSRDATSIDLVGSRESEGLWSWTAPDIGVQWEVDLGPAHEPL